MESHFFTQSGGLLYFGNGKTIDPSTGTAVSVTDLGLGVPGDGPVIVDEPLNTVFYLEQVGGLDDPWYLVVIATRGASAARDTITYRQPSSQDFVGRFPYAFVRYGAHGIAFLASNGRLFLLESDAIGAP
jgi:hypothetical protein